MADREKIIRIIDELIFEAQKEPTWKAENALKCLKKELLKEQEAAESFKYSEGKWCCSTCGETVGYFPIGCSAPQKFYNFCPECGREVKWE